MGQEEHVLDCKDHLLNMAEEYMQDVMDRQWMDEYMKPTHKQDENQGKQKKTEGFKIKGAP